MASRIPLDVGLTAGILDPYVYVVSGPLSTPPSPNRIGGARSDEVWGLPGSSGQENCSLDTILCEGSPVALAFESCESGGLGFVTGAELLSNTSPLILLVAYWHLRGVFVWAW